MANTKSNSLGIAPSSAAQVAGFCYLPFYVVLLSLGLQYLSDLWNLELTLLQRNLAYFAINGIMMWVIFHKFLLSSFRAIRFWELVQAVILGLTLYYAAKLLFSLLANFLKLEIVVFNDATVQMLAEQSKIGMIICCVIVAPMVEETLVRGLVFGAIRRRSRILAYVVSILLFAAIHVWQYLQTADVVSVLLVVLQYIPAGIALGWTYEKSNNIWAPIFMHMAVNAISSGLLNFL